MRTLFRTGIFCLGLAFGSTACRGALDLVQAVGNNGNEYVFTSDITNTTGVTLDSATIDYSSLLLDVANLPWNVTNYDGLNGGLLDGSVHLSEFLPQLEADRKIFFGIDNIGDVVTGWSGTIGDDGVVDLTNNGFIPAVTYDLWSNTLTMETFLGLDNSLFRNPETSEVTPVTLSSTETNEGFVSATPGAGFSPFTADGFAYEVQAPVLPSGTVRIEGDSLIVEFTGILQSSEDLSTWTDLDPQPESPYTLSTSELPNQLFFRARD